MTKLLGSLGIGVALAAMSGTALGTQCSGPSGVIAQYQSCLAFAATSCDPNFYVQRHPECFGAGSNTAAGEQSVVATSFQQILSISYAVSARMAARLAPPGTVAGFELGKGLAAGGAAQKWNVWGNVGDSNQKFDRGTFVAQGDATNTLRTNRFDSRIQNFVIGGDYQLTPAVALGLSLAFDNGSGSAASHTLAAPDAAKSVSTNGYSWAPYVGWQINKDWALDATMGWGSGEGTVDGTVKTDSDRFFYGFNLGYTKWYRNWQLTGKGSYLYGEEKYGDSKNSGTSLAGTGVTNKLGQFRVAGQAGYWMNGFMPYFALAYATDSRSSSATAATQYAAEMGRDAWVWSLGVNLISLKNNLTGGIAYERESGRSRSENDRLMANINYRF